MGRISRMAMLRRGARAVTPSPRPVIRRPIRVRPRPARRIPGTSPQIVKRFIGSKKAAMGGAPIKLYEVQEVYPSGLMPLSPVVYSQPEKRRGPGVGFEPANLYSRFVSPLTAQLRAKTARVEQALRVQERTLGLFATH